MTTPAQRTSLGIATRETTCPNRGNHVKDQPELYVDRDHWRRIKATTHRQLRCEGCGLWVIWEKR